MKVSVLIGIIYNIVNYGCCEIGVAVLIAMHTIATFCMLLPLKSCKKLNYSYWNWHKQIVWFYVISYFWLGLVLYVKKVIS